MNIDDILDSPDLPEWHEREPLPDRWMRDQRTQEQLLLTIWRSDPDHPECWMWKGRLREGGGTPGRFWPRWIDFRANSGRYEPERVPVAVWRAFVGPLGRTDRLVSQCGVKACVNPIHHRALTQAEWRREQRARQLAAAQPRILAKARRAAKQAEAAERTRAKREERAAARARQGTYTATIEEWREGFARLGLAFPDVTHLPDDPDAKYTQSDLHGLPATDDTTTEWVAGWSDRVA